MEFSAILTWVFMSFFHGIQGSSLFLPAELFVPLRLILMSKSFVDGFVFFIANSLAIAIFIYIKEEESYKNEDEENEEITDDDIFIHYKDVKTCKKEEENEEITDDNV